MDRGRFDALARLLATSGSRRVTLGALLGVLTGPSATEAIARKRSKGKERGGDRDRSQDRDRLQAEGRGWGGKRRKKAKKKRGGRGNDNGGQTPNPPPDGCCGTKSCPDPESGSTRSQCDYAGRSFAGQDHNGSIFRGVDGRNASFTATDNHGSVFAEACLQSARFRRARLDGATWEDACLFGADFTGADLGGDFTLFDEALFCNTTLPDGSVSNRDCGRATACCRAVLGGEEACQGVADGPDPSGQCAHCCEGECCPAGATECNPAGLCCTPNCAGKQCGPDGCGGTCGSCPTGTTCFTEGGLCVCNPGTCDGCCAATNTVCEPGDTSQFCGSGGAACTTCPEHETCRNGLCVCAPTTCAALGRQCGTAPDGCGGTLQCGRCSSPDAPNCSPQGVCTIFTTFCSSRCVAAWNLIDGTSVCIGDANPCITNGCSSDADCPQGFPGARCAVSATDGAGTMSVAQICDNPGLAATCSQFNQIQPCQQ